MSSKHRQRTQAEAERSRKAKGKSIRGGILLVVVVAAILYMVQLLTTGSGIEPPVNEPLGVEITPAPQPMGEAEDLALAAAEETPLPWNLLIVNVPQALSRDFTVDLETVSGGRVDTRCAGALRSMLAQAQADGVTITITSSYRNVPKQEQLYEKEIAKYQRQGYSESESRAKTERHTQPPGNSEHHTGLAVDLVTPSHQSLNEGFADTEAYRWLSTHAVEYGFVLRYPKGEEDITGIDFEPWHYRYVGREDAEKIVQSGLCLEEYVESLQKTENMGGGAK